MKRIALILLMSVWASSALALEVTSLVFSITSTAATSTPNLRIMPMKQKMVNLSGTPAQVFVLDDSAILNYYLTKNQSVTIDQAWGALLIQTEQDTLMKKNAATTSIEIHSGVDSVFGLK